MLDSNDEVEELCSLIVSHGEKHPLGLNHNSALKNVDLPRLFQFAAEKRVNFYLTRIEEVIRDSGAQS